PRHLLPARNVRGRDPEAQKEAAHQDHRKQRPAHRVRQPEQEVQRALEDGYGSTVHSALHSADCSAAGTLHRLRLRRPLPRARQLPYA
ncbi:hypothetical protein LTR53_020270, partial [Teratosphaeriaceae sp. CCFEE 6253]